eukprot:TRINITY_DN25910_c0_g1_i2.p1 TRINITY_DN25910_c0_g1~~TRINITY_DN25910_c0_g1_i2.p1  ORF type:complete len:282 (-),score=46.64 TRINITY_DN25910_c0_g1_i2:375-1220(-)
MHYILSVLIVACMRVALIFPTTRATAHRRILSIGDLHGDFTQTSGILRRLGLMDEGGAWTGGRDVLIQTGDIADRGHQEHDVYKALFRLQDEAPASGGEVILLLGNHEIMNMQGDYSYASLSNHSSIEGSVAERKESFGPQGWLGEQIRRRSQMVARIGEQYGFSQPVLYVHAGILPAVAEVLDYRNRNGSTDSDAAGQKAADALNAAVRQRLSNKTDAELREDSSMYFAETGPLWTRRFARSSDANLCVELEQRLVPRSACSCRHNHIRSLRRRGACISY